MMNVSRMTDTVLKCLLMGGTYQPDKYYLIDQLLQGFDELHWMRFGP